jgi:hypothetical protein
MPPTDPKDDEPVQLAVVAANAYPRLGAPVLVIYRDSL